MCPYMGMGVFLYGHGCVLIWAWVCSYRGMSFHLLLPSHITHICTHINTHHTHITYQYNVPTYTHCTQHTHTHTHSTHTHTHTHTDICSFGNSEARQVRSGREANQRGHLPPSIQTTRGGRGEGNRGLHGLLLPEAHTRRRGQEGWRVQNPHRNSFFLPIFR